MSIDSAPLMGGRSVQLSFRFADEEPSFTRAKGPKGRTIYLPNRAMEVVQREILAQLDWLLVPMTRAHGGIRERSIITNAEAHVGHRFFYITDLRDAYGTMRALPVARTLRRCRGFMSAISEQSVDEIVEWLEKYCFLPEGGLITGAASAPLLLNIHLDAVLDSQFSGREWERADITYTRYMDDLVFSSNRRFGQRMRREIRECIWDAGFQLADHKTRVNLDIQKGPIKLAGVMLDRNGRIFPSKRSRNRANGMLASALSGKISPAVAHGHVGACLAALPDTGVGRKGRSEVRKLREGQIRLIQERPMSRDG